ncbi:hypothetical protein NE237_029703 [Protea cynaroides]|uniref:Uncharacterized protein n=1 Tax=Protea cynaroides TaxID=273540 RepID=A0A9Q0GTN5_9MAGN|nr:hypothetical protein NE237_029703 [Protea cynaroides]
MSTVAEYQSQPQSLIQTQTEDLLLGLGHTTITRDEKDDIVHLSSLCDNVCDNFLDVIGKVKVLGLVLDICSSDGDVSGKLLRCSIDLIILRGSVVARCPWPTDSNTELGCNTQPLLLSISSQLWKSSDVILVMRLPTSTCKLALLITTFVWLHGQPPLVVTRHHLSP